MKYKISVRTVQGIALTFTDVDSYDIDEFGFVQFIDSHTGKKKRFHVSNCEIEEVEL